MIYEAVDCIDAGTDYCPCYLAETNNCLICSQLQGKLFCDCINWKGVCIYQEYVWNSYKSKERRESVVSKIIKSEWLNDKILFLKIKVTKTMARELNQPGSYIFMRNKEYPEFFDVPMSVMYSDEINETVDLLLQIRGVKTKVFETENSALLIRGPYWNGIMGLENLKKVSNKNCLLVIRGIAQAPAVTVAKKLRFSNNNVFIIFDKGSSGTSISKEYFEKLGCTIIDMKIFENKIFNEEANLTIREIINERDIGLIFSGGSDLIHKSVIEIKKSFSKDILFSCTNNATICCGEGICGSCTTRLKDGRRVKSCKSQVDPVEVLEGK